MRSEVKDLVSGLGLTKDQDWADVWTQFMSLLTQAELVDLQRWVSDLDRPVFGRTWFREVLASIGTEASWQIRHRTSHYKFFAWYDAKPWPEVRKKLAELLTVEIKAREASRGQEPVRLPEEAGQAGNTSQGTQTREAEEGPKA